MVRPARGVVLLPIALWAVRSPLIRAHLRGRGGDPGQWGSRLDHLADQGFGQSWNDDGRGGRRPSRLDSKHQRR